MFQLRTKYTVRRPILTSINILIAPTGILKRDCEDSGAQSGHNSDERDEVEEKSHVKQALNMNGYLDWLINNIP